MGRPAAILLLLILAGCGSASPSVEPTHSGVAASATPPVPPTHVISSPAPAIVGNWELDRTCAAIVRALNEANHPELVSAVIGELIAPGASLDPTNPCAAALPPTQHSHTFWPDGRFNSYDENDREVDYGRWMLVDDHTLKIGEPVPDAVFAFTVQGDKLSLTPIPPAGCTTVDCVDSMGWQFAVAFPGETWTRVTSGPHVP